MSIEGIPDGWELVRVGTPKPGEHVLGKYGKILHCNGVFKGISYVIIRKIEKPKRYRPFANAAEFEPHRDRWIKRKDAAIYCVRVDGYGDKGVTIQTLPHSYESLFEERIFEDGTPFGVEVTE